MKLNEKNLVYYATCKSPVDKSGFLSKRGERHSAYHKRWFVLKGNMLFYYDNEESKEPVGVIILEGCRVELCESTEEYAFAIKFECTKSRAYILAADCQSSMESWVKALTKANFEYIRLVVKELQKQLAEVQKNPNLCSKARVLTDLNLINTSSHSESHIIPPNLQDCSLQKDNGCATWDNKQNNLCNGIQYGNRPKCQNTREIPDVVLGASDAHQLSSSNPLEAGSGPDQAHVPAEDEGISFSQLHHLFGEEIVDIRIKWTQTIPIANEACGVSE
ncbi:Hypothetical predicted protein [Pelobates cultripes]|uniref:Sesquipedalian n=1 Tax=Pelobates cultripes TaxID=61616 RepID=A0AAD1SD23_PELCU|nr:Hypothetical predicted protein [Pelobates cultripes]CAH2295903.1 Hypothetical predicted protein [Pelobates cultripes]